MYEFWVKGESLYTLILPILLAVLMVVLIAIVFIRIYTDKGSKNRKIGQGMILLLLVSIVGYGYVQHTRYNQWIEQSSLINPGVRDRYKIMGYDVMQSSDLVNSYQSMNLLDRFRELDMYEEETVEEPIDLTYLGTNGNQHYFKMGDEGQYAVRYTGEITYTDEPTHLTGSHFKVVDERFVSLGFTQTSANYLDTFYINQAEADEAPNEFPVTIIHPSEVWKKWNLGHQPTKGTSLGQ
ncbi:hypothetical protein [Marinilactibacillus kalidii]|uniref:hypothetical protein n=1 Tax=Marinilactibacillus kalidii TaxID=2820274 RepID=UPI001ABE56B4|nr:hypothetical protein [Marinilactibacillus kalidii]